MARLGTKSTRFDPRINRLGWAKNHVDFAQLEFGLTRLTWAQVNLTTHGAKSI